ncbi:MAG: copper homeostasis membrane protein CopD [Casimicrobiaceae bacterium]
MVDSVAFIHGIHFAATLLAAGVCFFVWAIAPPAFAGAGRAVEDHVAFQRRMTITIAGLAMMAFVSGVLWLLTTAASMSGRSVRQALDPAILGTVITRTQFGRVWAVHLVLCAVLLVIMVVVYRSNLSGRTSRWWGIATALGAVLAAALAGAGHAAADDGPFHVHLIADVLHLLASAVWLGSLLPLTYLLARAYRYPVSARIDVARVVITRFSSVGMVCVATLLARGMANSWFLVGTIPALIGTAYGRVLLIKLALFVSMIGVASINRFWLTPKLASSAAAEFAAAARSLCRNVLLETGLGFGVLMAVGVLNVSVPAAHG